MKPIVAFPPIGPYSKVFKELLKELDCEVLEEMPLSKTMTDKGCKHSANMVCFPYKITLGYFMEALDKGANTLLMFDSGGECRFKQYYKLQEYTLRKLGYKNFRMIPIKATSLLSSFKKINNQNRLKIIKVLFNAMLKIRKIDLKQKISDTKINIGVIGEIYTAIENSLNFDIEKRIRKQNMNSYNAVTMGGFLKKILLRFTDKYHKQAKTYFNGKLGGARRRKRGINNNDDRQKIRRNHMVQTIKLLP